MQTRNLPSPSIPTPSKKYLQELSKQNPDASTLPIDVVFPYGVVTLLTAENKEFWATWFYNAAIAVLRLHPTNPNYVALASMLNATATKISPLQQCVKYNNIPFCKTFLKLGCSPDAAMVLPNTTDTISIRNYVYNEGLLELQRAFR